MYVNMLYERIAVKLKVCCLMTAARSVGCADGTIYHNCIVQCICIACFSLLSKFYGIPKVLYYNFFLMHRNYNDLMF